MKVIKKYLTEIGRKGGEKTKLRGSAYYKKISKLAIKARRLAKKRLLLNSG